MVRRVVGAAVLVLTIGAMSRADDRPLERVELDKRIVNSVYETTILGTDLFNKGKHDDCYRLFQGALLGIQPLLDHRPDLMNYVKDRMEKAARMKPAEGAFVLREALDAIQDDIAPSERPERKFEPKTETKTEPRTEIKRESLWNRLGGEKEIRSIIKDFLKAAEEDKKVNFFRNGMFKHDAKSEARMEQLFVEFISYVGGGPLKYSDKRKPEDIHRNMKITDAEFDAMLVDLKKTLDSHKVGKTEADDLIKFFGITRPLIVGVQPKDK